LYKYKKLTGSSTDWADLSGFLMIFLQEVALVLCLMQRMEVRGNFFKNAGRGICLWKMTDGKCL